MDPPELLRCNERLWKVCFPSIKSQDTTNKQIWPPLFIFPSFLTMRGICELSILEERSFLFVDVSVEGLWTQHRSYR